MTPSPDADRVLLLHIQECLQRVDEYTQGDKSTFFASRLVQDAVVRNLQTLAESTQRLSDTAKEAEPTVPWAEIAGFRNVLTHGYMGLDLNVVWTVIAMDLPGLRVAVEARLMALGETDSARDGAEK